MKNRKTSELWAIAAYFNPMGWRRRLENFRVFRRHLDVPLVVVELAYGDGFELRRGDADILVQRRGRDVLWQKERLLNIALEALPLTCRAVAWIDVDVLFEDRHWPAETVDRLRFHPLVHLYRGMTDLGPAGLGDDGSALPVHAWSAAERVAAGSDPVRLVTDFRPRGVRGSTFGLAWAARRDLLDRVGFYDGMVVGGGDRAMAAAVFGVAGSLAGGLCFGRGLRRHYLGWARRLAACLDAPAGFLGGRVFHLWHGEAEHRLYERRFVEFSRFGFDPYRDVAVDAQGALCWCSDKTDMHRWLRGYFHGRREDGGPAPVLDPVAAA